jgi:hypothetical protein
VVGPFSNKCDRAKRRQAMILEQGEKVHITERRYFADDLRRHLAGEVVGCTEQAVRGKGYVWVFDTVSGFVRKPEKRERILSLADRLTINVLPPEADLDAMKYVDTPQQGLVVTDETTFSLEITEFSAKR